MVTEVICNEGCKRKFGIYSLDTENLPGQVDKVSFDCPYCRHKYVAYYTDREIRLLQSKLRNTKNMNKRNELSQSIKAKMDELRKRMEPEPTEGDEADVEANAVQADE